MNKTREEEESEWEDPEWDVWSKDFKLHLLRLFLIWLGGMVVIFLMFGLRW